MPTDDLPKTLPTRKMCPIGMDASSVYCSAGSCTLCQERRADKIEIEMLRSVLELVREYPDFDEGGPIPEAIDDVLAGRTPKIVTFLKKLG